MASSVLASFRRFDPSMVQGSRIVWGATCLLAPSTVTGGLGGPTDRRTITATRALGVRHLTQGVVSIVVPTRSVLVTGGLVDAVHCVTVALLGGLDCGRRRLAWCDGVIEAGFGVASVRAGRRTECAVDGTRGRS
jgi:hypothetical protein